MTAAAFVSAGIERFLSEVSPPTPFLVVDVEHVRARYRDVHAAFPSARVFYAVKANPSVEIVSGLVSCGASFEVASVAELERCLLAGASVVDIAFTNTIKKREDVAEAYRRGIRLFTFDSLHDLENIAEHAAGSGVVGRFSLVAEGAKAPLGDKFGCAPGMMADLLVRAQRLGLDPVGVAFHPGSQQLNLGAWEYGIARAATIFNDVAARGVTLRVLNLGGGLPARYVDDIPPLEDYAAAIEISLDRHFPGTRPEVYLEPGRALVADAGVLRSQVVVVAQKDYGHLHRWVYLDVGRYGGLAETEGEMIAYRLRTNRDGDATGPVILAGPTGDGDDVLYRQTRYRLPLTLTEGDHVDILSAGAYTASYASIFFNGLPPLRTYCVDSVDEHVNLPSHQ